MLKNFAKVQNIFSVFFQIFVPKLICWNRLKKSCAMEQPVPVKEVKILETAEDIQERREQVSLQLFFYLILSLGVSICLDVVSIETLDLDTKKKSVSTVEKISTVSKS